MEQGAATALTAGEAAYARLRADIVCGRFAPGQRLRLDRMREAYGVAVGTLREILSRLAAEGLVLAEGQRGFEVPPVHRRRAARALRAQAAARGPCADAVLRRRRRRVGGAGGRRAPQARGGRAPDDHGPARRGAGLEALRRRVPPGADLGLRLAGADGRARQRLRPLPALPDGRLLLPRRGRGRRAPGAPRLPRSTATRRRRRRCSIATSPAASISRSPPARSADAGARAAGRRRRPNREIAPPAR